MLPDGSVNLVGVDRIELASTRVSEGEREAARLVTEWARKRDRDQAYRTCGLCGRESQQVLPHCTR